MLYHFFHMLADEFTFLNVTRYITFRAMIALLTALFISILLSPWYIRRLKLRQMGQVVRDDGPKSHFSKAGTPTMGGGLITFAVLIPSLMWMSFTNPLLWYAIIIFAGYAILGFVDDYSKITKKNTKGVTARQKLFWQTALAAGVSIHYYIYIDANPLLYIPFCKNVTIPLGIFSIPFYTFIIVGSSNAVNLTDGLDGLAIGHVMIAALCFTVLAYVTGHSLIADYLHYPYIKDSGELSIFAGTLFGAGMGFLWYNSYPAQVFMGDVGSLPLGGALGVLAVFTHHELLWAIIGGVFMVEAISVITQVASFKLTGKRIFKMAPIHHHFELQGWPETKVVVRFWIVSAVLAMIGLLNLKLR